MKKTSKLYGIKVYVAGIALGAGLGVVGCNTAETIPEVSEAVSGIELAEASEEKSEVSLDVEVATEEDSEESEEEELTFEEEFKQRYAQFPEKKEIPAELLDSKEVYQPADVTREQLEEKIAEIEEYYSTQGLDERDKNYSIATDIYTMLCANRPFISEKDLTYILDNYAGILSFTNDRIGMGRYYGVEYKTIPFKDLLFDEYLKNHVEQLEYCALILQDFKEGNKVFDYEIVSDCREKIREYGSSFDNPDNNVSFQFSMGNNINDKLSKSLVYIDVRICNTLPADYQESLYCNIDIYIKLTQSREYSFMN